MRGRGQPCLSSREDQVQAVGRSVRSCTASARIRACVQGSYGWAGLWPGWENSNRLFQHTGEWGGTCKGPFWTQDQPLNTTGWDKVLISPKEAAHTHTHSLWPHPCKQANQTSVQAKRRPAAGQQIASGKPPGYQAKGAYMGPTSLLPGSAWRLFSGSPDHTKYLGPVQPSSKTRDRPREPTTHRDQQPNLLKLHPPWPGCTVISGDQERPWG